MSLESILSTFGISASDAASLASEPCFHHKTKSRKELEALFDSIADFYDCSQAEVVSMVVKFPQFASLNHERVVQQATQTYGSEEAVKKVILKFPPFAGLNHERVARQKCRLGRLVGMDDSDVLELILSRPALAGYSAKRYLAGIDVCRTLESEGFEPSDIQKAYFNNVSKSPYVPHHKRKRVSQVPAYQEPPLMVKMRKSLKTTS